MQENNIKCEHKWIDDGDNMQIICERCGEAHEVKFDLINKNTDVFIDQFLTPNNLSGVSFVNDKVI
jgi:hypothetical protein